MGRYDEMDDIELINLVWKGESGRKAAREVAARFAASKNLLNVQDPCPRKGCGLCENSTLSGWHGSHWEAK